MHSELTDVSRYLALLEDLHEVHQKNAAEIAEHEKALQFIEGEMQRLQKEIKQVTSNQAVLYSEYLKLQSNAKVLRLCSSSRADLLSPS